MSKKLIQGVLGTFIGRVVLALYTLVVVPLLPAIINFLNNVLGYELTDTQVNSYASKAAIAIGVVASVWLVNRGLFERLVAGAKKEVILQNANTETKPINVAVAEEQITKRPADQGTGTR